MNATTKDNAALVDASVPHVDWAAIIAGALLASAIGFVLMTFGSGLGLSLADPIGSGDVSPVLVASMVGLWTAWVVVSSFFAGGYLTGRMRRRAFDASAHEVDVRDGTHGLTVWALGVLIGGYLAGAGLANLTGAVTSGAAAALSAGTSAVADSTNDPLSLVTDQLLRSNEVDSQRPDDAENVRAEIARLLSSSIAAGEIKLEDEDYLATLVQRVTGLNEDVAKERVSTAIAEAESAAETALAVAETARKSGILMTFLLAAVLVVGAAAAWWAATIGGKHRDEGIDFSHIVRWK